MATDGEKLAAAGGDGNPNMDKRDRMYAAAELFRANRREDLFRLRGALGARLRSH